MATEAAIPQRLSSDLAKAATLPDVLKKANINWNTVKKVDGAFDTVPTIKARGAELKIDKDNFPDPDKMRKGTRISVGDKETNLVDHVLQDEQLRVILQEGMRLNLVNEADFRGMGLEPRNFQKGEAADLQMPGLNRLQKSEVISLLLHRLGESNGKTTSLFLDEASKLILDTKNVKLLNQVGGTLSNQSLINALAAGGREELNKYIVEQGYEPFAIDKNSPMRRVMAKLVSEDYAPEGVTRIMKETTPYFAEVKDGVPVPEYSARVDMNVAQAMTNAMMPPEFHLTIARLESQILATQDVAQAEDMRHAITRTKQKAYAALLNAYGVADFQKDGKVFNTLGFLLDDQNDILAMAKTIKESPRFKEAQNLTMFEANRFSLSEVTAEITGIQSDKLKGIVLALPIEQTVEELREQARANMVSEDVVELTVRGQLARSFVAMVDDLNNGVAGNLKGGKLKEDYLGTLISDDAGQEQTGGRQLNDEQRSLLEKFFLNTYDTERSLLKKGHTRFSTADAPTKVKIGTPEAINQGAKGLRLLFVRSITEQRYDFDTYKQELIKGAAEAKDEKVGTVLEQGQMKEDAVKTVEAAEKARVDAEMEKQKTEAAEKAARELELQNMQELHAQEVKVKAEKAAYDTRTVEQSLNVNDDTHGDELSAKIASGDVTSDDIDAEMDNVLGLPSSMKRFTGIRRWLAKAALHGNQERLETYQSLEDHRQEALDAEEAKRQELADAEEKEVSRRLAEQNRIKRIQNAQRELAELNAPNEREDSLPDRPLTTADRPPTFFDDQDVDIPAFLRRR